MRYDGRSAIKAIDTHASPLAHDEMSNTGLMSVVKRFSRLEYSSLLLSQARDMNDSLASPRSSVAFPLASTNGAKSTVYNVTFPHCDTKLETDTACVDIFFSCAFSSASICFSVAAWSSVRQKKNAWSSPTFENSNGRPAFAAAQAHT